MIIPFGKYKGRDIKSIYDDEYLVWFSNLTNIREELRLEIREQISYIESFYDYDDEDFEHPGWYGND